MRAGAARVPRRFGVAGRSFTDPDRRVNVIFRLGHPGWARQVSRIRLPMGFGGRTAISMVGILGGSLH